MRTSSVITIVSYSLIAGCVSLATLPSKEAGFTAVVIRNATRGMFPSAVAVGRFSGGPIPDFAIATWGDLYRETIGGIEDGSVSILVGEDKTGRRFLPTEEHAAGRTIMSLEAADFDRDGKLDVAVVGTNTLSGLGIQQWVQKIRNPGEVRIFLGNGDGTFKSGPLLPSPVPFPLGIAVGDVNGDGFPDIIVGNQSRTAKAVALFLGGPGANFRSITLGAGGINNYSVALADFDGNNHLDIAIVNGGEPASISILFGDGTGKFTPANPIALDDYLPISIAVGDFNRDDQNDLVIHTREALLIYRGDGKGSFARLTELRGEFAPQPSAVRVADLDNDGNLDVVISTSPTVVTILFGDGRRGFKARLDLRASYRSRLFGDDMSRRLGLNSPYVADVDGDGYLDVVVPAFSALFMDDYLKYKGFAGWRKDIGGLLVIFFNRLRA